MFDVILSGRELMLVGWLLGVGLCEVRWWWFCKLIGVMYKLCWRCCR